jgi:hypothetical protein
VTLQQSSWLTVVIVCGISVILLAVGGYTGYSIVVRPQLLRPLRRAIAVLMASLLVQSGCFRLLRHSGGF